MILFPAIDLYEGRAVRLYKGDYSQMTVYSVHPEETAAGAIAVAGKLAKRMREKLYCDGINLVQNNGSAAGQTVMHFHLHVIPRYEKDGQHILWNPTSPSAEELAAICGELNS